MINRHLYYYVTPAQSSQAPSLIFESHIDARDFINKSRGTKYIMNTCWGYNRQQYAADREHAEDHAKDRGFADGIF